MSIGNTYVFEQCLEMLQLMGDYDPESRHASRYQPMENEDTLEVCGVDYVKDGRVTFSYTKEDIMFAYFCYKEGIKGL